MRASTNPRDLVLDPFCGSGTTGVVCARTGPRFVGIDLIKAYLNIAAARLCDAVNTDQLKLTFRSIAVETIWIFHWPPRKEDASGTWAEIVSAALKELGGEGHLREINQLVERNPRTKSNVTWPSTVRRVVRQSARFETLGRGRYRLRHESFDACTFGDRLH